jgi:hypothetical protein
MARQMPDLDWSVTCANDLQEGEQAQAEDIEQEKSAICRRLKAIES